MAAKDAVDLGFVLNSFSIGRDVRILQHLIVTMVSDEASATGSDYFVYP
jgi:hypothetical protein